MFTENVQNSVGLTPLNQTFRVWARGQAFTKGQVAEFDIAQTNAAVTNNKGNDDASGLCNVVLPGSTALTHGFVGVFLENTSQNQKGMVRTDGYVEYCYVHKASGNIAVGDPLFPVSGQAYLSANASVGTRAVAKALETKLSPSTPTLCKVLISGIRGIFTKSA